MLLLFLQAVTFLPETQPSHAELDNSFRQRCAAAAQQGQVPWQDLKDMRPVGSAQESVLVDFLKTGSPQEARLAAVLASGSPAEGPLTDALFRIACQSSNSALALSCILAPTQARPAHLPALAFLALDKDTPIELRAAALGRVLELGCTAAWPLAMSLLSLGTPAETLVPGSLWPKTGRYELPKRLLLESINTWLFTRGLEPAKYEPNASWEKQEEALSSLSSVVANETKLLPPDSATIPPLLLQNLFQAALAGNPAQSIGLPHEGRALAILWPKSRRFLADAAANGPGEAALVRKILAAVQEKP